MASRGGMAPGEAARRVLDWPSTRRSHRPVGRRGFCGRGKNAGEPAGRGISPTTVDFPAVRTTLQLAPTQTRALEHSTP